MNTKYSEEFFDSYLRGECSSDKKQSFESACEQSAQLKKEFEQFKSYRELVHGSRTIQASDQFTNDVIRKVRQRSAEKTDSLRTLFTGFFSRELIGVMATLVIIVVVFWPQLQPDRAFEISFTSKDSEQSKVSVMNEYDEMMMEETVQEAEESVSEEPLFEAAQVQKEVPNEQGVRLGFSDMSSDDDAAPQVLEEVRVSRVHAPSAVRDERRASAPVVSEPAVIAEVASEPMAMQREFASEDQMDLSASGFTSGDQVQARSELAQVAASMAGASSSEMKMEREVEERVFAKSAAAKRSVQYDRSEQADESDIMLDRSSVDHEIVELEQQLRALETEPDDKWEEFPFEQFQATVDEESGDTILVTVPKDQAEALLELWTKHEGTVLGKKEKRRVTELKLLKTPKRTRSNQTGE